MQVGGEQADPHHHQEDRQHRGDDQEGTADRQAGDLPQPDGQRHDEQRGAQQGQAGPPEPVGAGRTGLGQPVDGRVEDRQPARHPAGQVGRHSHRRAGLGRRRDDDVAQQLERERGEQQVERGVAGVGPDQLQQGPERAGQHHQDHREHDLGAGAPRGRLGAGQHDDRPQQAAERDRDQGRVDEATEVVATPEDHDADGGGQQDDVDDVLGRADGADVPGRQVQRQPLDDVGRGAEGHRPQQQQPVRRHARGPAEIADQDGNDDRGREPGERDVLPESRHPRVDHHEGHQNGKRRGRRPRQTGALHGVRGPVHKRTLV